MFKSSGFWIIPILLSQPLAAEVTLAPLFQEGGVLQREKSVPVWGHATPGKAVAVNFGGQTLTTTADAAGRWHVTLSPMPANAENQVLKVTEEGLSALEIKDLLVGEVWLGSGQSNMDFRVSQTCPEDQALAAARPLPLLRLYQVPMMLNHARQEKVTAKWTAATPQMVSDFSAVGYFFGKRLAEELHIPVGIIHSSWGGSRIEPWWAEEGLVGIEELATTRQQRLSKSPGFPEYDRAYRSHITTVGKWADAAGKAMDDGISPPEMPPAPELLKLGHNEETGLYQAMIHPLIPYALRGFLWYQGESNNGDGMAYTPKMQALINGWRHQFAAPEAPFLFVQIAPYNYGETHTRYVDTHPTDLPNIWWAQQQALKIPHTGMAVTNDIGDTHDIHPTHKAEISRRLALWALADTYGKTGIVKSGPLFAEYEATNSGIVIRFDHSGSGLATRDGKSPTLFEVAGIDGNYQPANAQISEDKMSVVLTCPTVAKPDRARFAWSQTAEPNLINKEGLPAAAFNTHWPVDPTLGHKVSAGKPFESSHPNTYGWNTGLTDGIWGSAPPNCYATNDAPDFPKTVTVDLGSLQTLHAISYGTPTVGSTKTVVISISEDGKNFTEVAHNEIPAKKASTTLARFQPAKARFIRATFVDHHPQQDNLSENFCFLSELEAYAP
jgi:sialate O-acetylesterase